MDDIFGNKSVFTTGEIARIFGVNINTVVKWFEVGLLKGYKLPGSDARRVPRDELVEFLARRQPAPAHLPKEGVGVVLASSDKNLVRRFREAIAGAFGYSLHVAQDGFGAGMFCTLSRPEMIFVHLEHSDFDQAEFKRCAGDKPRLKRTSLVAVTRTDMESAELAARGFDNRLLLPAGEDAILDAIDEVFVRNQDLQTRIPFRKH